MAKKERFMSDREREASVTLAQKVWDEWEKTPSSYSECNIQKITLKRWANQENRPSVRSLESLLRFLRLTQKRWNEFAEGIIDFETFWALRGKELEERIINKETVINDARTLTQEERMFVIQELAKIQEVPKITTNTVEKVELVSLDDAKQLKRLKSLLISSRASLGDDFGDDDKELETKTFQKIINEGASKSLITSIIAQEIQAFPKKEFETLAKFLLKPSRWVGDHLTGVSDQKMNSYEDLMSALA